jgi:hypothetical protein
MRNLYGVAITMPAGARQRKRTVYHWLVVAESEEEAVATLRAEQPQAFMGSVAVSARMRPPTVFHMVMPE